MHYTFNNTVSFISSCCFKGTEIVRNSMKYLSNNNNIYYGSQDKLVFKIYEKEVGIFHLA